MLKFNKEKIDEDILLKRIFHLINLNLNNKGINLEEYITLRNYNNAYDILLVKEKKINYRNFPVLPYLTFKKL
jgi:hypothetical protein